MFVAALKTAELPMMMPAITMEKARRLLERGFALLRIHMLTGEESEVQRHGQKDQIYAQMIYTHPPKMKWFPKRCEIHPRGVFRAFRYSVLYKMGVASAV